uniref:Flp pilus assembly protein RcpC/CpaB n=1 Tax=Rheinheimera sp. BAL341 TaxID=1708203 RepID=A0A486XLB0_9GAMM
MVVNVDQSKKSWLLLVVALGVAALAFWLASQYLANKESIIRQEAKRELGETITIVVASRDVAAGEPVGPDNMAVAEVDAEFVSGAAITPDQFSAVNGRITSFAMSQGEPLVAHYLGGQSIARFSDLLNQGERAVTLEIDNLNAVAGMLLPGDYVDVMLLQESKEQSASDNKILQPLLQKVRILSVDAISLITREDDFFHFKTGSAVLDYGTVTVAVKYRDAAMLALARESGELAFMLRGKQDASSTNMGVVTAADFVAGNSAAGKQYQLIGGSTAENGALTVRYMQQEVALPRSNQNNAISVPLVIPQVEKTSQVVN